MKLRRRIGSVFLAFAMALSLIPSVAVSALAADTSKSGNYVSLEYQTGVLDRSITVNVYIDGTIKETISVGNAAATSNTIKIKVNDGINYEIDRVDQNGGGGSATDRISSDFKEYTYPNWAGDSRVTFDVYLREPLPKPDTPNDIYNGSGVVYFKIYEDQLLKLLYLNSNQGNITADTNIESVSLIFRENVGAAGSAQKTWSFTWCPPSASDVGYRHIVGGISNWDGKATPYNISSLNITYGNGSSAIISADALRCVYQPGATDATGTYVIEANNDSCCAVAFYEQDDTGYGNAGVFHLHDIAFVKPGETVTTMPEDPEFTWPVGFAGWSTDKSGGVPFNESYVVNSDMRIWAQKYSSDSAGTWIYVDNVDNAFLARFVELYNNQYEADISVDDVDKDSVKIQVNGENEEHTNWDYYTSPSEKTGWDGDGYAIYKVYNYNSNPVGTDPGAQHFNTHIPFAEIRSITISATVPGTGGKVTVEIEIHKGNNPGEFGAVIDGYGAAAASDGTFWLKMNQGEADVPVVPPYPGYTITGIDKELVGSANEVTGIDTSTYTFPVNGTVLIPNDGSVTLLYAITVTGEEGATFSVTDMGAQLVTVSGVSIDQSGNDFTGTISDTGSITFYVSKTFNADDITEDGKLTNTAKLTGDNAPTEGGEDTEEVDAKEETNTVYVYVQFVKEDGSALSDKDKQLIKSTYGTGLKEDGYMPIGYFDAAIPSVDGYGHGADQFSALLGSEFVLDNDDITAWATGVNKDSLNLAKDVTWTKLSVAYGALDFGSELDDDCWHLDGKITLSDIPQTPEYGELKDLIKVQVDCLTSNSWGEYAHQNKDYDLIEDSYTPGNVTLTDGTWTCTVSIRADKYVTAYNEEYGDHTLSSASPVNVTVVYKDNAWIRENANNNIAAVFDVKCAEPTIPSEDEIVDMFNDTGAVKVDCITSDVPHNSKGYALLKDSFKIGEPETKDNRLVLPITVTIDKYLEQYEEVYGEHDVSGSDTKTTYDVYWNGTQWTFDKDVLPLVDFDVKCIKPEVPGESVIDELFDDTGIVKVECIGEYVQHNHQTYAALDDTYRIGTEVVWQDGHWTIPITFTRDKYVDQYCTDTGVTHTGSGSDTQTTHKVFWDGQKWTYDKEDLPLAVFDTKCSMPAAPGEDEITEILSGKDAVKVICQSTENHPTKEKTYKELLPNKDGKIRYKVGNVTPSDNDTFTLDITILPDVYVNQYNEDTKLTHWLTDNNPDQIVTLTWTKDTGWTASDKEGDAWATFEVTCLPEKPTYDDLTDDDDTGLLDGKDAVKVICVDNSHDAQVYKELWDNKDGKTRYVIGEVVRNTDDPDLITCDVTILPEVYVNQYNTNTQVDHWLTDDTPQTITLTWDLKNKVWTAPTEWTKEAWAVFEVSCAAITITPADIVIYTGGEGYAGVLKNAEGVLLGEPTSGLPEPGYHIELPDAVDAWLEAQGVDTSEATHLDQILRFAYDVETDQREWGMSYVGIYELNEDGTPAQYVYSLNPAVVDGEKVPVSILFTDADNNPVTSDDITMSATAASAKYTISINPGKLDQDDIQAVFTVKDSEGNEKFITCNVEVGTGELTVKSTTDDEYVNEIGTVENNQISATGEGVTYYVNDSQVTVDSSRVGLLVDSVSNSDEFNTDMEEDAISEVREDNTSLASDAQAQSYYLDLVDTDNGNAVVTMGDNDELTIYWPMPEDADPNGEFYIVHYDEMDRATATTTPQSDPDILTVSKDGNHLTFTTGSFSPFVLVYEQKDSGTPTPPVEPDDPTPPPVNPNPPQLNTEDHYAYIVGYEDGTVRPEGDITRAEVATIFFRLLTDESRNEYWSQTNDYTDVAEGDWYNNAVSTLSNAGILNGYEDGSFQPNGNITRAEFATIAARFFEATYEGEDLFPDIKDHWARDYINQAAHAGIVNGYEDGTFQPQENITRAEAMTIVNRTLDRHPDADHFLADMVTWPDNLESAWYYEQVQEATNSHEYVMKTDADKNPYEIWKEILPVRDWSDLENTWSEAHAG